MPEALEAVSVLRPFQKDKSMKLLESHYAIKIFHINSGIQAIFDPRVKETYLIAWADDRFVAA